MKTKERLLLESKAWKLEKASVDKDYFKQLQTLATPDLLWISSTDNIVSVNELINAEPGNVLVYNNIGCQVRVNDLSMVAMIENAVVDNEVNHIIICGYSECSAVNSIINKKRIGDLQHQWLQPLYDLYKENEEHLKGLSKEEQHRRLIELNIQEQVSNLSRLPFIQERWAKSNYPSIYGWYLDLPKGELVEICALEDNHIYTKGHRPS